MNSNVKTKWIWHNFIFSNVCTYLVFTSKWWYLKIQATSINHRPNLQTHHKTKIVSIDAIVVGIVCQNCDDPG